MDELNQPTSTLQTSQVPDRMNSAFENSNGSGSRIIPIIIAAIILILVGAGSYMLGTKKSQPPIQKIISQPSPTPTPDPTADWKIYSNNKLEISFKYPNSYTLKETEASATTPQQIYLEKNGKYISAEGAGNGSVIAVTISPNKDLSEAALKKEFGIDTTAKTILVGNKEGVEIVFQPEHSYNNNGRTIYLNHNDIALNISLSNGIDSKSDQKTYLTDFDQILSTFKFTP